MVLNEFRVIPGYENYKVNKSGVIKSVSRDLVITPFIWDDYLYISTHYDSPTKALKVSRAVALAWVPNPDPEINMIVNHIDGDKLNNWYENLEWTTYSGNNYHAVNSGLRSDNICCQLRDFETGTVLNFNSISQAAEAAGLRRDTSMSMLLRKKFGALINNRYEFKFESDPTPWFYETRKEKISPARYMVLIEEPDGVKREVYSTKSMLKEFQLYDRKYGGTIPDLVKYAAEKYPEKKFTVRDGYLEPQFRIPTIVERKPYFKIRASHGSSSITFPSLTQAAKYFNVDRSCIKNRLENGKDLNGYTFSLKPA